MQILFSCFYINYKIRSQTKLFNESLHNGPIRTNGLYEHLIELGKEKSDQQRATLQ